MGSCLKDKRPARQKYWNSKSLEENKIKNIIKNGASAFIDGKKVTIRKGCSKMEASIFWNKVRKGRIK